MNTTPYLRTAHYYETDQMGIVHHSNYIRWFEEARVHLMDQAGYGYRRMEEEGIASPVLGIQCQYHSMVRFGDTVSVEARISSFTGARMCIVYQVRDAGSGALRATGESQHCFLNGAGRPVSLKRVNPEVYSLFASWVEAQA